MSLKLQKMERRKNLENYLIVNWIKLSNKKMATKVRSHKVSIFILECPLRLHRHFLKLQPKRTQYTIYYFFLVSLRHSGILYKKL